MITQRRIRILFPLEAYFLILPLFPLQQTLLRKWLKMMINKPGWWLSFMEHELHIYSGRNANVQKSHTGRNAVRQAVEVSWRPAGTLPPLQALLDTLHLSRSSALSLWDLSWRRAQWELSRFQAGPSGQLQYGLGGGNKAHCSSNLSQPVPGGLWDMIWCGKLPPSAVWGMEWVGNEAGRQVRACKVDIIKGIFLRDLSVKVPI